MSKAEAADRPYHVGQLLMESGGTIYELTQVRDDHTVELTDLRTRRLYQSTSDLYRSQYLVNVP